MNFFRKKSGARLDYHVDWSAWLFGGDEIYESSWEAPDGIELSESFFDGSSGIASVWVSGGTEGKVYELVNRIVTMDVRRNEAHITIRIT